MKSILEDADLLAGMDLMDLDPEFLNAVAGGSGGQECCVNPQVTTYQNGSTVMYGVDCMGGHRPC